MVDLSREEEDTLLDDPSAVVKPDGGVGVGSGGSDHGSTVSGASSTTGRTGDTSVDTIATDMAEEDALRRFYNPSRHTLVSPGTMVLS